MRPTPYSSEEKPPIRMLTSMEGGSLSPRQSVEGAQLAKSESQDGCNPRPEDCVCLLTEGPIGSDGTRGLRSSTIE